MCVWMCLCRYFNCLLHFWHWYDFSLYVLECVYARCRCVDYVSYMDAPSLLCVRICPCRFADSVTFLTYKVIWLLYCRGPLFHISTDISAQSIKACYKFISQTFHAAQDNFILCETCEGAHTFNLNETLVKGHTDVFTKDKHFKEV